MKKKIDFITNMHGGIKIKNINSSKCFNGITIESDAKKFAVFCKAYFSTRFVKTLIPLLQKEFECEDIRINQIKKILRSEEWN